jgi:hypothetical protein
MNVLVATHRRPDLLEQTIEKAGGFCEDVPCCQERELNLRLAGSGASFR